MRETYSPDRLPQLNCCRVLFPFIKASFLFLSHAFERVEPSQVLSSIIKEFWIYENEDSTPTQQKIIPDGYSEIIIHYGDVYRINITGKWEVQEQILFSNQISKFFFLENTGQSAMIGIKLHPCSFHELFQIDLGVYTDHVFPLIDILHEKTQELDKLTNKRYSITQRVEMLEKWISTYAPFSNNTNNIRQVVDFIFESNGMFEVRQLSDRFELSTRQLERQFKKVTGVTIKFFARIIRFNYIFQQMKEENKSWVQIALSSGYFDQSHFIKNFKEFTGEEPSIYGFDKKNLANFFLSK